MQLGIFDGYGKLRNLDDEADTIASLPNDVRATLFETIAAVTARDECSERVYAARRDVRTAEATYNAALEADQGVVANDLAGSGYAGNRNTNPITHQSALAAVIDANNGKKPEPTQTEKQRHTAAKAVERLEASHAKLSKEKDAAAVAKVAGDLKRARASLETLMLPVKLRAARDEAELALAEARIVLQKTTTELRDLERVAGEAINAWRLCQTTPSAEQVTREYLARSGQERANAAAANPPAPHQPWPLEVELKSRGKTKVNRQPTYFGPR